VLVRLVLAVSAGLVSLVADRLLWWRRAGAFWISLCFIPGVGCDGGLHRAVSAGRGVRSVARLAGGLLVLCP